MHASINKVMQCCTGLRSYNLHLMKLSGAALHGAFLHAMQIVQPNACCMLLRCCITCTICSASTQLDSAADAILRGSDIQCATAAPLFLLRVLHRCYSSCSPQCSCGTTWWCKCC
jgi:hypothetical protein